MNAIIHTLGTIAVCVVALGGTVILALAAALWGFAGFTF